MKFFKNINKLAGQVGHQRFGEGMGVELKCKNIFKTYSNNLKIFLNTS